MRSQVVLDFSKPDVKMRAVQAIMTAEGPHEWLLKRRHRGRTLLQNAYYWSVIIPAMVDGLFSEWGERVVDEDAHAMLKERYLKVQTRRIDPETGEILAVLDYVRSTTTLTTVEFSDYIDECRRFLLEWLHSEVEDPNPRWRELKEAA